MLKEPKYGDLLKMNYKFQAPWVFYIHFGNFDDDYFYAFDGKSTMIWRKVFGPSPYYSFWFEAI